MSGRIGRFKEAGHDERVEQAAVSQGGGRERGGVRHGISRGRAGGRAPASRPRPPCPSRLGMASYTLRLFPVDQAIEMTKRLGLTRICFKDFHLKLDATPAVIAETVAKVKAAGLDLYAGGVIYMKTRGGGRPGLRVREGRRHEDDHRRADVRAAAVHEQEGAGVRHPRRHPQPRARQPALPDAAERVRADCVVDRRLGLCMDAGHTQRSGIDPAESAEKYFDRLFDVHIKDVSAATAQGRTIEIGRGVIDIPKLLRTLKRLGLQGHARPRVREGREGPAAGLGRVDRLPERRDRRAGVIRRGRVADRRLPPAPAFERLGPLPDPLLPLLDLRGRHLRREVVECLGVPACCAPEVRTTAR